jgi:hypothetical protein
VPTGEPAKPCTADLYGVSAAVPLHQVPYRMLELPVMQSVELTHGVPEPASPDLLPLRLLLPLVVSPAN